MNDSGLQDALDEWFKFCKHLWGFPVAQSVKSLHAIQETWVRFLGREDPLEKEVATHSSVLAWEISWTEELGGPTVQEVTKESDAT